MSDGALADAVEQICVQLCRVAAGDLSERLTVDTDVPAAQKLALLSNGVLEVARRAVLVAYQKEQERAVAAEMAQLASWRVEMIAGRLEAQFPPEFCRMIGIDYSTDHTSIDVFVGLIDPTDRDRGRAALQRAMSGSNAIFDCKITRPDGGLRHIWTNLQPRHDGDRVVRVDAVSQDVTERRRAEDRIRYLAEHDGLTGLMNRATFRERLNAAIVRRGRRRGDSHQAAVLYIDLDGFKAVNDRHGHSAGDAVLREAASRMRGALRSNEKLARLGGDEFALLVAAEDAARLATDVADRIITVLNKPYELGGGLAIHGVSASVGVAIYPVDGRDSDALISAADTAMYSAKSSGKGQLKFFDPVLQREIAGRRRLEADLRLALERRELFLDYQPLVSVADGAVIGFEALLRWRHPDLGLISPDRFIPLAESSGFIHELGDWVLHEAIAEAASWREPVAVAVNVSPVQLQTGARFVQSVAALLQTSGLDPVRLELEVTEGLLIREPEIALEALRAIRALGVRVALDDFGTGYSSLATLQSFPFDKIKIDRRFINGLEGSSGDAAIVRAVLGLAQGLSLPVVAEGVETPAQLEALRSARCDIAQGWLFGKPGPIPATLRGDVVPYVGDSDIGSFHSRSNG